MTESNQTLLGICLATLFSAACIALAWVSHRRYREVESQEKERAAGLDAPDMDENFAHQLTPAPSIEQVSRDKGAV